MRKIIVKITNCNEILTITQSAYNMQLIERAVSILRKLFRIQEGVNVIARLAEENDWVNKINWWIKYQLIKYFKFKIEEYKINLNSYFYV